MDLLIFACYNFIMKIKCLLFVLFALIVYSLSAQTRKKKFHPVSGIYTPSVRIIPILNTNNKDFKRIVVIGSPENGEALLNAA